METIKLIILLFLTASRTMAFDHVLDNGSFFGGKAEDLNTQLTLQNPHIYVATFDRGPENLEQWSKDELEHFGHKNTFIILVSRNPRLWRITMYPSGLVPAEMTDAIGKGMVAGFKHDDFYGAVAGAATALEALAIDPPSTTTTTTRHTYQEHTSNTVDGTAIVKMIVTLILVVLLMWAFVAFIMWCSKPRKTEIHNHYETGGRRRGNPDAGKVFNSYTAEQRQSLINPYMSHPSYYPGLYNNQTDFLQFMLMMDLLEDHHYGGHYADSGYSGGTASSRDDTTTTTTTSYSTPSGSDDSGSSGSWGGNDTSSSISNDSSSGGGFDSSSSSSSDSSGSTGGW